MCAVDLSSVLDALIDPAAVVGHDFRVMAANRAYRDTFGSGGPVLGRPCYELSHRDTVPCEEAGESCPIEWARRSGSRARALHVHFTSEGEEHHTVTIHPLRDTEGRITSYLEILSLARVAASQARRRDLVGHSPAFKRMLDLLARVAPTSTTALLLGESGSGKELVARTLHEMSPRAQKSFVPVDCSGLSESLFESELFGHEKGAFTGAFNRKRGLVELANGGTLFLDEVGDIPLSLQVKLLRLLETRIFRRVGNVEQLESDFRLVCATHRDLKQMVEEGTFRRDLYFRISAFPVPLPPLRDRPEDIELLARTLLDRLGYEQISGLHPGALASLQSYDFPGNVRELHNILERACLLAEGDTILSEHLPPECTDGPTATPHPFTGGELLPLEAVEARYLHWAVARFPAERAMLAERLGISERTLYRKLERLRVETPEPSSTDS